MNSNELYNQLVLQYDYLTKEEQMAILIYQSKLYLLLNSMTTIPHFLEMDEAELFQKMNHPEFVQVFESFRRIVKLPKNLTIRHTVFSSIDFTNLYTCLHSLKKTYLTLMGAFGKIILPDDLSVYRGVSIGEEEPLVNGSIGEFLSTDMEIENISSFLFHKPKNHIFKIHIPKGYPILFSPYSIVLTYDAKTNHLEQILKHEPMTQLKVIPKREGCQKEIILFHKGLHMQERTSYHSTIQDDQLTRHATVHQVDILPIENRKQKEL